MKLTKLLKQSKQTRRGEQDIKRCQLDCMPVLPEVFPEALRHVVLQLAADEVCKDALYVAQHLDVVLTTLVQLASTRHQLVVCVGPTPHQGSVLLPSLSGRLTHNDEKLIVDTL